VPGSAIPHRARGDVADAGAVGQDRVVRTAAMEDLEAFIGGGQLWEPEALAALIARLEAAAAEDGDVTLGQVARFLHSVLVRQQIGPVPARLAADIEGIVYPRLFKVMEALWDDLPAGELRTRIEVMNRRLSRLFATEAVAGPSNGEGPPS
jgi:hypothetical protein